MSYYHVDKYKAHKLQHMIHKDVMDVITDNAGYVAGGAITSLFSAGRINDIDVFFPDRACAISACVDAIKKLEVDREPVNSEACLSFYYKGMRYQFIKMLCQSPTQVIDEFDFTVCQAFWIPGEDGFSLHPRFMEDLASRSLVFNIQCEYPIASMVRVRKFLSRGYHISGIELVKIGLSIQNLKFSTLADIKKQLLGVDTLILAGFMDELDDSKDVKYDMSAFLQQLNDYLEKSCEMFSEKEGKDDLH